MRNSSNNVQFIAFRDNNFLLLRLPSTSTELYWWVIKILNPGGNWSKDFPTQAFWTAFMNSSLLTSPS